ncbi:MAG TPA: membrane protein insertase YidC [Stellaceae bacterium]|nr:membrane protein insertase YidC [Stellaceae bacterium]
MEQRNLLIAIVVSVGILIGFQFVFQRLYPPSPAPHVASSAGAPPARSATGSSAKSSPATSAPSVGGASAVAPAIESRAAAVAGQPRVVIDTPRLHGSIALVGARFDDLTLATYHETVNPKSPEVVLLSPPGTAHPYLAEFGWVAAAPGGEKLPGPQTRWTALDGPLTPSHPVRLTWDNGQGLHFTRTISVDQNYMFTVHDAVHNTGSAPVSLLPYGLISRTGTPQVSSSYLSFEGLIGNIDGSIHDIKYTSLKSGQPTTYDSTGGWLGFTDTYWLTSIIPPQHEPLKARFTLTDEHDTKRYQTDYLGTTTTVPPGGTATASTRFFAGAKELDLLTAYTNAGIPLFDYAIDFGWFWFISKPMFQLLELFYKVFNNFGVSILVLTLLVKLLFFPLANKSYRAMSKMKLLQPEMQKLRERFPDDKARQQQEMMAVYKRVGANPLAGCLPIVVQIPVFYALYQILYVAIDLRHAPFFGWIRDLSAPDPTSFVNLFGLLPFTPPSFLMIGAWPIIMGVTMFLQQKLNPQPVDAMQARMFMVLPLVFTYMLARFPAGLVIYWAWSNILSIAQQWVIMHRAGAA